MKTRQIIIVAVAILILFAGKLGKDWIASPKERSKPAPKEQLVTVFTDVVKLRDIPLQVTTTGSLEAKDRMELYSEVQGLMLNDKGRFNAGNQFQKGQILLSIRADDARAAVIAQRSAFERTLSSVMADIRIDYPSAFDTWDAYLKGIDVQASLPELPTVTNSKLKSYLNGRDVFTSYYNVRNTEIELSRFTIRAPFNGTLITADVDPGTVIRNGQLLGVFIRPGVYELQASTDARTIVKLKIGQSVTLSSEGDADRQYTGKVSRINSSIDPATQLCEFFVEVRSDALREGEFLSVNINAEEVKEAYEISRSALKNTNSAYVVEDGKLRAIKLDIMHLTNETAMVHGLENGQEVLTKLPPAVFGGMKVNVHSEAEVK
jgi:multidrug efflux pump subunit AcrA (membrane-fusion protein)